MLRVGTLIAGPLGAFRIVNCTSPDYLRRYDTPQTVEDLAQHS